MEESIRNCHFCGAQTVTPYRCPECGYLFCSRHRLPEQHDCVARRKPSLGKRRPKRVSWLIRVVQLVIVLCVLGGALVALHVSEVIDLFELFERLREVAAG